MIAETGLAALWLAAGLAAYQFVLMLLALRSRTDVVRPMRAVAVAQGALTLIAFAMLLLVFARSDMSVKLVFEKAERLSDRVSAPAPPASLSVAPDRKGDASTTKVLGLSVPVMSTFSKL